MRDGMLSWEQLAQLHFKLQTLQPYARDASGLKAALERVPTIHLPQLKDSPEMPFEVLGERTPLAVTFDDLCHVLRETRSVSADRVVSRALAKY